MKKLLIFLLLILVVPLVSATTTLIDTQGRLLNKSTGNITTGTFTYNETYNQSDGTLVYTEQGSLSVVRGIWNFVSGQSIPIDPYSWYASWNATEYLTKTIKINNDFAATVNLTYTPLAMIAIVANDSKFLGGKIATEYVPYTGATTTVDLGGHDLDAFDITATNNLDVTNDLDVTDDAEIGGTLTLDDILNSTTQTYIDMLTELRVNDLLINNNLSVIGNTSTSCLFLNDSLVCDWSEVNDSSGTVSLQNVAFINKSNSFNGTQEFGSNVSINGSLNIDGITLSNFSDNGLWNGSLHIHTTQPDQNNQLIFAVEGNGTTGVHMPHFWIQNGAPEQASGISRSFMIVNEIVALQNTTNITSCTAVQDRLNVPAEFRVDCNTSTSGADLIVGDDVLIGGDVRMTDLDGRYHSLNRFLQAFIELASNTMFNKVNSTIIDNALNISDFDGRRNLSVIINSTTKQFETLTDSIDLINGTSSNPTFNYVSYQDQNNPVLTIGGSDPSAPHADVAKIYVGNNATEIYLLDTHVSHGLEFIDLVYDRFDDDGAIYKSGLDISSSATDINFTTGVVKLRIEEISYLNNVSSSGDFFIINGSGNFTEATDNTVFTNYADGGNIAANKYFNVVWGVVPNSSINMRILAVVQNEPTTEYSTLAGAKADAFDSTNFFPGNTNMKKVFIPIARTIHKLTVNNPAQNLNGNIFHFDIRGQATSSGGGAAAPPITNHNELNNLDFASAGHTGFASNTNVNANYTVLNANDTNLASNITAIRTNITTLFINDSNLASNISAIKINITTLFNNDSTLANNITALQDNDSRLESKINLINNWSVSAIRNKTYIQEVQYGNETTRVDSIGNFSANNASLIRVTNTTWITDNQYLNETVRVGNMVINCSAGQFQNGSYDNGTPLCSTPPDTNTQIGNCSATGSCSPTVTYLNYTNTGHFNVTNAIKAGTSALASTLTHWFYGIFNIRGGNLTLAGTSYSLNTRNASIVNLEAYGDVWVDDTLNVTLNLTLHNDIICNLTHCFTLQDLNTSGGSDTNTHVAAGDVYLYNTSTEMFLNTSAITRDWGNFSEDNKSLIRVTNISWVTDNQYLNETTRVDEIYSNISTIGNFSNISSKLVFLNESVNEGNINISNYNFSARYFCNESRDCRTLTELLTGTDTDTHVAGGDVYLYNTSTDMLLNTSAITRDWGNFSAENASLIRVTNTTWITDNQYNNCSASLSCGNLPYMDTTTPNPGSINLTDNITIEAIHFENNASNTIKDNATCVIIEGATVTMNIC